MRSNMTVVSCYMPMALKEKVRAEAYHNNRHLTGEIETLLNEALEARLKKAVEESAERASNSIQ